MFHSRRNTFLAFAIVILNILILDVSGKRMKRMDGGIDAIPREFRYIVAIYYAKTHNQYGYLQGGGAIISDRFVLTGAQTVDVPMKWKLVVVSAIRDKQNPAGEILAIEDIFIHPDYVKSTDAFQENDIALILLQQTMTFGFLSGSLQQIFLPRYQVKKGQTCILAGPQEVSEVNSLAVDKLNQSLIDSSVCGGGNFNSPKHICAHLVFESIGTDDHGSSLIHDGHVVGLVSKRFNQYAVYTNVYFYNAWITKKMALIYKL